MSNLLTVASKSGGAAGADDFTPLLIYVVIRARTPMLASNLSYIERFRMASKLTGESHYYYIQLVRAPNWRTWWMSCCCLLTVCELLFAGKGCMWFGTRCPDQQCMCCNLQQSTMLYHQDHLMLHMQCSVALRRSSR